MKCVICMRENDAAQLYVKRFYGGLLLPLKLFPEEKSRKTQHAA